MATIISRSTYLKKIMIYIFQRDNIDDMGNIVVKKLH